MGANERPHEKPAHKVRIPSPFAIGQYEVTYEQWDRCVHAGACRYRPVFNGPRHEAIGNLSWDDANAYLKWISEKTGQVYRLPSEAEWEYAARADSGKTSCTTCVSPDNEQTSAPGSHKPNPFGLYDTVGNMAEWVQDCWNESYQGSAGRWLALDEGQLQPARLKGRFVRQQHALPLRQRCALRGKRFPRSQGAALAEWHRYSEHCDAPAASTVELTAGLQGQG